MKCGADSLQRELSATTVPIRHCRLPFHWSENRPKAWNENIHANVSSIPPVVGTSRNNDMPAAHQELLERVFRDPAVRWGLNFFTRGERNRIQLRENADGKVEIWCIKRERWLRAKPEEVVRQVFLVWVRETLRYSIKRVLVEWPIQMGEDEEKERSDIV